MPDPVTALMGVAILLGIVLILVAIFTYRPPTTDDGVDDPWA